MTGRGTRHEPSPPPSPFLDNVLLFGHLLRQAGLPIAVDQVLAFARALAWVEVGDRQQVYHTARSLLVCRRQDLDLFTALFDRFWSAGGEAAARRPNPFAAPRRRRRRDQGVSLLAGPWRATEPEAPVADRAGTYSPEEVLRRRDFSELSPEELAEVRRLIRETRWQASLRRTRRRVADDRGERLDLRRLLRAAARHGGAAFHLPRQRRKVKQRPLVLLADVSGSMEKYSRLLLQLFYSLTHGLREVECFVFGTRLTRVSEQLLLRDPDRALDAAARQVEDWSGGTRIGESLAAFNRRWSRRVLRRGAVVVIASDGWERGDSSVLRREVQHLQRRCHRLIWLNPHLGRPGYRPLVEGMAAALPHVDDFLPVHNLRSLADLARHLAELPARRGGLGPRRRPS